MSGRNRLRYTLRIMSGRTDGGGRLRQPGRAISRRGPGIGDAVGNAHATESAAGEEQSGIGAERAVDVLHALQVSDFVLGACARKPIDASECRRASDAEYGPDGRQRLR